MDIGKDVLTRTLLGSTEAEKVFTPWWITVHHYLVYTIVILGLIAVPINCMLGVNGNCSYKFNSDGNYLLPMSICRVEEDSGRLFVETRFCSPQLKHQLKVNLDADLSFVDGAFEVYNVRDANASLALQEHRKALNEHQTNYNGCLVRANPRLFGFFVYWACVDQLSSLALYFPYLVLTLALVLVLLERLLTRYLWTGQRIEKFYELLVKEVLNSGDIEKIDTKENKQRCQHVLYDFKHSWFYCRAYILQTYVKLAICGLVLGWSLLDQCNLLRESFKTDFECKVFDYVHGCSIPSNGMNLIIFDLCNIVLFLIVIDAVFNLVWHYRFYGQRSECMKTKLGKLIQRYEEFQDEPESSLAMTYNNSPDLQMLLNLLAEKEGIWSALLILCLFDRNFRSEFRVRDTKITSTASERSSRRKDVTLAWNEPRAASFIGENVPTEHLMYVLEINPPIDTGGPAGGVGGSGNPDNNIAMMPACSVDGKTCLFKPVERKLSDEVTSNPLAHSLEAALAKLGSEEEATAGGGGGPTANTHLDKFKKAQYGRRDSNSSARSVSTSSMFSAASTATSGLGNSRRTSNTDSKTGVTIVEGVHDNNPGGADASSSDGPGADADGFRFAGGTSDSNAATATKRRISSTASSVLNLRRKTAMILGRKRSDREKVRAFSNTFSGLRSDTEYVITVSFVLSGRKLGSESFTILSHDRKNSVGSVSGPTKTPVNFDVGASAGVSAANTPKTSTAGTDGALPVKKNSADLNPVAFTRDMLERKGGDEEEEDADSYVSKASDSSDLSELLARKSGETLVVLEFVASWCGLCNMIAPQIELMAEEWSVPKKSTKDAAAVPSAFFVRADVEECPKAAEEFGVEVLPSILLIRHGEVLDSFIGQQLKNVREAMKRIQKEEDEVVAAASEAKSAASTTTSPSLSGPKQRRTSLEAVVVAGASNRLVRER